MIYKKTNILVRLMAFVLVVLTLSSTLSVTAFAGDSVFLETLLDTDKYVYVAQFTSDTKTKQRKYAYKYMNMQYQLTKGCISDTTLGSAEQQKNPNYCYALSAGSGHAPNDFKLTNWGSTYAAAASSGELTNYQMFMLTEGYIKGNLDENWNDLIESDSDRGNAMKAVTKNRSLMETKAKKTTSPLSYPGYWDETVTTEQTEYAQNIHNQLVGSLNGILSVVNDGKRFDNVVELVNKSIMIRPDSSNNIVYIKSQNIDGKSPYTGYVLVYADLTSTDGATLNETSAGQINSILKGKEDVIIDISSANSSDILNTLGLPRANYNKALLCYIFPISKTDSNNVTINPQKASVFPYAIPKGFIDIKTSDGSMFYAAEFTKGGELYKYANDSDVKRGDSPWISIHMLSQYANLVYKQFDVSIGTYVMPDTNIVSKILAGILNGILYAIRGVLNLTSIEDLVFNLGRRGSGSYNMGLMSENWWHVVLQYQLVFQAIAWVVLVCGFIKTLIDLNLSTINPQKRMSLYETIQKFIVVGIGLVILIPVSQFLLECNDTIVELFASQIDTSSLNMPTVPNPLVQFLFGILWLVILIYLNFLYIMRSVTVALLIASGPFFIATIAWGRGGTSSLFVSWGKELVANIFVQSVHAFVLSFLVQILVTGTGLETFAIGISIIPLTEMFRGLIFAGAGGSTSQMATSAISSVTKAGKGISKGIKGGLGDDDDDRKGGGGGSKSGVFASMSANRNKRIERLKAGKNAKGEDATRKDKFKDAAGIAGNLLGTAGLAFASNAPEMLDALSDLMVRGDANGVGQVSQSAAKGAVQDIKAGAEQQNAFKTAREAASHNKSVNNGVQQNANTTSQFTGNKTNAGAQLSSQKALTGISKMKDLSGSSDKDISKFMEDFEKDKSASSYDAVKSINGHREEGKVYEKNGVSTFISNKAVENSTKKDRNAIANGKQVDVNSSLDPNVAKLTKDGNVMKEYQNSTVTDMSSASKNDINTAIANADPNSKPENVSLNNTKGQLYKDKSGNAFFVSNDAKEEARKDSPALVGTLNAGAVYDNSTPNYKNNVKTADSAANAKQIKEDFNSVSSSNQSKTAARRISDNRTVEEGHMYKFTDKDGNKQEYFVSNKHEADITNSTSGTLNGMKTSSGIQESVDTKTAYNNQLSSKDGARFQMKQEDFTTSLADKYADKTEISNSTSMMGADTAEGAKWVIDQYKNAKQKSHTSGIRLSQSGSNAAKMGTVYKFTDNTGHERQFFVSQELEKSAGGVAAGNESGLVHMTDIGSPNGGKHSTIDLSKESSYSGLVDAAWATAYGKEVHGQEGVYSLGNNVTVNTGMSKSEATDILSASGYSNLSLDKNGDGRLTYTQKENVGLNAFFNGGRHSSDGKRINTFKANVNQAGGPKWSGNAAGTGGTMTFASQRDATMYFMKSNNHAMANAVSNTGLNQHLANENISFSNNGENGFAVTWSGGNHENFMTARSDGDIITKSKNGQDIYDPFAVDLSTLRDVTPNVESQDLQSESQDLQSNTDSSSNGNSNNNNNNNDKKNNNNNNNDKKNSN
jgi:hypothetical protein